MIDTESYRSNVGIILADKQGRVFWARRISQNAWQFPQGGIQQNESPVNAMYRELEEEVGLTPNDVHLLGNTEDWLHYQLPKQFIRYHAKPLCIGQKQKWFLLSFNGEDTRVCLDASNSPEFDHWRWVHYWHPLREVIYFKRSVYRRALKELKPLLQTQFQDNTNTYQTMAEG